VTCKSLCYPVETPLASRPIMLLCVQLGQFALDSDTCRTHYAASFQQANWPLQTPEHTCHPDLRFLVTSCSMYCFHWFALLAWCLAEVLSLPFVSFSVVFPRHLFFCILLLKQSPVTFDVNDTVYIWTGQIYARNGIAETASPLVEEQAEELADCEGLVVRVRGDGQVYTLVLTTGALQLWSFALNLDALLCVSML